MKPNNIEETCKALFSELQVKVDRHEAGTLSLLKTGGAPTRESVLMFAEGQRELLGKLEAVLLKVLENRLKEVVSG